MLQNKIMKDHDLEAQKDTNKIITHFVKTEEGRNKANVVVLVSKSEDTIKDGQQKKIQFFLITARKTDKNPEKTLSQSQKLFYLKEQTQKVQLSYKGYSFLLGIQHYYYQFLQDISQENILEIRNFIKENGYGYNYFQKVQNSYKYKWISINYCPEKKFNFQWSAQEDINLYRYVTKNFASKRISWKKTWEEGKENKYWNEKRTKRIFYLIGLKNKYYQNLQWLTKDNIDEIEDFLKINPIAYNLWKCKRRLPRIYDWVEIVKGNNHDHDIQQIYKSVQDR